MANANGLINDPFAASLVRAVGIDFCTRVVDGELELSRLGADGGFPRLAELSAARTRLFDKFFVDAANAKVHQMVILAAGLDTRGYRLWWPAGSTLYEIDRPQVIEFKTTTMRSWGAAPKLHRRAVSIDLQHDWPTALRRAGFDTAAPTAWIADGLLIGSFPPDAQDRFLDNVTGLSCAGSRLATDYALPPNRPQAANQLALAERWRRRGLDIDFTAMTDPGEQNDVARYLADRGWSTVEHDVADLFAATRMPPLSQRDLDGAPSSIGYLSATWQ